MLLKKKNDILFIMHSKCKKEMTYFLIGLGSFFIWTITMWISLIVLRVDESIGCYVISTGFMVFPFAVYFLVMSNGDYSSLNKPHCPPPVIEKESNE